MSEDRGPGAWVALVVGLLVMAFGVHGLLTSLSPRAVRSIATWVIGADLLHDLVAAPLLCLAALGLRHPRLHQAIILAFPFFQAALALLFILQRWMV